MTPAKNLIAHANWLCAGRPIAATIRAPLWAAYLLILTLLIGMFCSWVIALFAGTYFNEMAYIGFYATLLLMAGYAAVCTAVIASGGRRGSLPSALAVLGVGHFIAAFMGMMAYPGAHAAAMNLAAKFLWVPLLLIYGWLGAAFKIREKAFPVAQAAYPAGPTETPTGQTRASLTFVARPPRFNGNAVEGMEKTFADMVEAMGAASRADGNPNTKNGVLLHGLPGGGKTFLAEAAAGELKLPFLPVDIGKVNSMWIGQTTSLVTKVFDDALAQAPCVLFLDEVDSLLPDRSKITQAESEASRIVNTLLTRTVELRGSGVVLVAATNHLQRLDQAAIRDGRFDWKIEIPMPDLKARIGLLRKGLAACRKTASQETFERLSRHWEGFDVARIKSIAEQACKKATGHEVSGLELMQAYLDIRGNRGDALPENTPGLKGVYLAESEAQRLSGLARRMSAIIETEEKGGTIPSGLLFHGASGTGKSLAARALARETGWSFLSYKGPDLLTSPDAIDNMIERARNARPAIVFLDEADDLLMERGISQNRQYTNKLLAAMDGSSQVLDVLFVAATNHPDLLDQAMLRGGRFGQKIEFSLPDAAMVQRYLDEKHTAKPMRLKGIGTRDMARILTGMSFANIEDVLKSAINHDIDTGGGGFITQASLVAAANDARPVTPLENY